MFNIFIGETGSDGSRAEAAVVVAGAGECDTRALKQEGFDCNNSLISSL